MITNEELTSPDKFHMNVYSIDFAKNVMITLQCYAGTKMDGAEKLSNDATPKAKKLGRTSVQESRPPTEAQEPQEALPEDVLVAAQASLAEPVPPRTGLVISITRRCKHRKLHAVQACRLVLGVHYKEWVACGELLPPETDFESVCSRCMPAGPTPAPEEPEVESDDSRSSSPITRGADRVSRSLARGQPPPRGAPDRLKMSPAAAGWGSPARSRDLDLSLARARARPCAPWP